MPPAIFVLHENDEWLQPLAQALEAAALPYESWHLGRGLVDLSSAPPEGVFFSRMSASSHTRGHERAPELAAGLMAWLERHGRRVINGTSALRLELSKIAQYMALEAFGIRTPRTVAAYGRGQLLEASNLVEPPFITKHNRSGKGLGVRLFHAREALAEYLRGPDYAPPVDGLTLIQQYVAAPEPIITRLEFIGGRFFYAVKVDASEGFELCPADSCAAFDRCALSSGLKFEITGDPQPGVARYEAFLKAHGIEVAGVEYILDRDGTVYTYDINTNTNYNPAAEAAAGVSAMRRVASFLGRELALASR
jgi:hypothetical protein